MTTEEWYVQGAFVFAVTGAALSPWPWVALLVAAAFFVAIAIVNDRRTPPPGEGE